MIKVGERERKKDAVVFTSERLGKVRGTEHNRLFQSCFLFQMEKSYDKKQKVSAAYKRDKN
jgi:hypothetical protein